MTEASLEEFSKPGFVRVEEAFSRDDAGIMCELVWDVLGRKFGILKSDPSTWDRPFKKGPLNEIGHSPLFWSIFTDRLTTAIDDLLGAGRWKMPGGLGDFLITFPNASSWFLPHDGWHSDEGPVPGVMGFIFLSDVEQGGGGTLVVQGSHRLPQRDRMAAEPDGQGRKWKHRWELEQESEWLRALRTPADPAERYKNFVQQETQVEGVNLKVVELTGRAGDAVLCHPWLLHAIAPNAADAPRFMRSPRIRGDP